MVLICRGCDKEIDSESPEVTQISRTEWEWTCTDLDCEESNYFEMTADPFDMGA